MPFAPRSVLAVVLLLATGCATEPPPSAQRAPAPVAVTPPPGQPAYDAPRAEPAPTQAAPPQVAPQQRAEPEQTMTGQKAPNAPQRPPPIGSSCSPDPSASPDLCGAKGKISLEYDARRSVTGEPKCKMSYLPMRGVNRPFACVDGAMLYAGADCIACRMALSGWSARALITELTDAQAKYLQNQLGLDAGSAWTTAADWKRAIGAKATKP